MARKSILNNYYIFDASEKLVVIPGGVPREKLVLITNVTDNRVIYNFSDPELTAASYTIETDIRNVTTTRVVLTYDTTSMSDSDKLQIIYDDFEETVQPAETYHDAVNKQRVSTPQSQIDTDFEYGTQSTKWEGLAMINNNPFAYKGENTISFTEISAAQGSRVITVSSDTNPGAGNAIYVQDTRFPAANGVFIVDASNSTEFTYTAKSEWTIGGGNVLIDPQRTAIYLGIHYTGSALGGTIALTKEADNAIRVDTTYAHGLEIGNEIAIVGSPGTNVNGSWSVARVESPTRFYYYPDATPSGTISGSGIKLYPRPQGNSVHRAFDGGVKFSTNSSSKNHQSIRQTKRYFRYQSGKGVAFSTGSILAPAIENIDFIGVSGGDAATTITVKSADSHDLSVGSEVDVRGCDDNNYNGIHTVSSVVDPFTFKYTVGSAVSETTASGEYVVTPINSYGSRLEIGMMDQQNGIFFRYASGNLSVVRRSSTFQISGRIYCVNGSTIVNSYTSYNGESTKFSKQLKPGDYVVIRGSSYRVDGIVSDTQMVIFPAYRGPNDRDLQTDADLGSASNLVVTKTVETEWNQSDWNIDRCDGSGKSGYNLDVTKMQMFYLDYSWYGAGFIRWGFRGTDGNVIYAHKIPNNNFNTEAYMRSGNLPARYEVNTIAPATVITKSFNSGDSTLYVKDAPTHFPSTGTLRVKSTTGSASGVYEYINYSSKKVFSRDVISVDSVNDSITVSSTTFDDGTSLSGGGVQTITFDRPFSNIVAGKTYYIAQVLGNTSFTITETAGQSIARALTTQIGTALSPLARASAGNFSSITREQAGAANVTTTFAIGNSTGTVSSGTGIQSGQRVIGSGVAADTYVYSISGTAVQLSRAVTATNPTLSFIPMGSNGTANSFTYNSTQPVSVELIQATYVPRISHWGSSVIMEGRLDDDRAYVYTVGSKSQRTISTGQTRAIIALRVAPSVDNGIAGEYGTRELVNRMQLVLRQVDISATGKFFVELVLNPVPDANNNWLPVGGTSLAEYSILSTSTDLIGGEVIFGFYADNDVKSYDLSDVKEISNSILGGGGTSFAPVSGANPTGIFPDGPEVLAVRVTNIAGGQRSVDARFSWTEAQA